jgi:hypothetical protein
VSDEHDDDAAAAPDAPELDEATVAAHLERLGRAIAALDDDTVKAAVGALSENSRTELASNLQLPRATLHLGSALAPLLRRKASGAPPQRRLSVAFTLTEPANDETVHALGDRHENPSRDDLDAVLPDVIEHHGTPLVTLMLAAYAASDAPCQAVMAELLDTDERFAIGDPVPDDGPRGVTGTTGTNSGATADAAEREAKREERKAAKAARKEAQQKAREAAQHAHAARKAAQRSAKRNG